MLSGEGTETKMDKIEWAKSVKERDNWTCQECGISVEQIGTKLIHAHHIKPVSIGGENILENGITVCKTCHWEKYHSGTSNRAKFRKNQSKNNVGITFSLGKLENLKLKELAKQNHRSLSQEIAYALSCYLENEGESEKPTQN